MIQLLQRLDSTTAAAFTLCAVDDRPSGVVPLPRSVATPAK